MSDNNGMVNIIAPDGTAGQVPSANAQAAINAGGRIGVHVYAPDGTAGFIPHDQLPAAIKAGATATPHQSPDAINNPVGFGQSVSAVIPSMAQGLYHNVMDAPRNPEEQRIAGTQPDSGIVARALGHVGLGGYRTLIAPAIQAENTAEASVKAGHPLQALSEAMEGVPLIGGGVSAGKQAVGQYASGDTSGAMGTVAGNLLTAGMAGKLFEGKPALGDAALTPEEVSARQITKAVNPATAAYQQVLDATKGQIGNVLDYAKRNNISLSGNGYRGVGASLAKVAGLAKDETAAHYEGNVLGPHENVQPGGVTQGELAGTDPTLRQIDDRIRQISADQQSPNRKPTPGQVMGASDAELVAERSHLSRILHDSLGDLTGSGSRNIAEIRQRMAQLSVLSGETQGASNSISRGSGAGDIGTGLSSGISVSPTHIALHNLIKNIPGFDPETNQGKAIIKALSDTPIKSTTLPDTNAARIQRYLQARDLEIPQ